MVIQVVDIIVLSESLGTEQTPAMRVGLFISLGSPTRNVFNVQVFILCLYYLGTVLIVFFL